MSRSVKTTAAVLLCLLLGLHWALLQSVAWTTMLLSRIGTTSFTVAVATTFDGRHPCQICRLVREGQKAEKQPELQWKLQKLEAAPLAAPTVLLAPAPAPLNAPRAPVWSARSSQPDLTPPRRQA